MTVLELLKLCSYEDLEKKLKLHYNDVNMEEFRKLHMYLSRMTLILPTMIMLATFSCIIDFDSMLDSEVVEIMKNAVEEQLKIFFALYEDI